MLFHQNKTLELQGVYYTIILFCSANHNIISNPGAVNNIIKDDLYEQIFINGNLTYFNYFGFLSGELAYTTNVYVYIIQLYTTISLINSIVLVLWFSRMINPKFQKTTLHKLLTICIICALLESLINFHIYNRILSSGIKPFFFELLVLFFSLIRNITIRVIVINISLGYLYLE